MQFPSLRSITTSKIGQCDNDICNHLIKINKKCDNFKCMKYNTFNFGYGKLYIKYVINSTNYKKIISLIKRRDYFFDDYVKCNGKNLIYILNAVKTLFDKFNLDFICQYYKHTNLFDIINLFSNKNQNISLKDLLLILIKNKNFSKLLKNQIFKRNLELNLSNTENRFNIKYLNRLKKNTLIDVINLGYPYNVSFNIITNKINIEHNCYLITNRYDKIKRKYKYNNIVHVSIKRYWFTVKL